MLKFNNTHIFTGFLKQKLASFNLPKYKVYTKYHRAYRLKYGTESPEILESKTPSAPIDSHVRYVHYIKDGSIMHYADGKWDASELTPFIYDVPRLNWTKNLIIKNNIYDTYTHEYLGDYLRFIRDYHDVDLMSLYNCFSNKICSSLYYEINFLNSTSSIIFDTSDTSYKIYMLPVKLFKKYTIAIDCDTQVEICCGIYNKYQDTRDKLSRIPTLTYKKFSSIKFLDPVLYDKILNLEELTRYGSASELAQNESALKMFIKLPANNTSSIVVLEGDYRNYSDTIYRLPLSEDATDAESSTSQDTDRPRLIRLSNCYITNYENFEEHTDVFKPISSLQLLQANTGTSYPFADRLIEYLIENTITPLDEITANTERVQAVMANNSGESLSKFKNLGFFDDKMRRIIYDYMQQDTVQLSTSENSYTTILLSNKTINHDILGYVDKDVEKYYASSNTVDGKNVSLMNIDLTENSYPKTEDN